MSISVFLSHNSIDKPFVRKLAVDLGNHGIQYWIDEAELKVGDSLINTLRDGIDEMTYLIAIISSNSIDAPWIQREIDVAMTQEINGKKIKVLPLLLEQCELPGFLLGKVYADFTNPEEYEGSFKKLINSLGIVFNKKALQGERAKTNLGDALDKAMDVSLPFLCKPFHRPYQYIGMSIVDAAKAVEGEPNKVGNIIIENNDVHMLLEAEGNFINYVDIDIKATAPKYQNQEFDSEPVIGCLSINPEELELIRKQTHYHTYYDHKKKLKIGVSCLYDGAPLNVSFSSKYYGM